MKKHDLIVRTYQDATFVMNRNNWNSIFFEGTLTDKVSEILAGRNIQPPKNRKQKNDFLLLQKSIKEFLKEDKYQTKDMPEIKPGTDYSVVNLCKYARQNWQVINASIELLSKCNQNCRHCYWEELTKKGLELRYLLPVAKELKEAGVIFILLTGGETFLRPDITEILSCLNELGFAIEIKTNGSLLTKKIMDFLSKIKIYDLQVSIYEIKNGHSAFTRSNYNFSKISENVNLLLSLGVRVSLSVTVGNHNLNKIEQWHEKLISVFGESVNISYSPYITPNRGGVGEEAKLRLSQKDLNDKFYGFLDKVDGFPAIDKYRSCGTQDAVCYAGRDQIVIDPDGFVHPCLDLRLKMGNIKEEPITEILKKRGSFLNAFSIKDIPKCMGCSLRDYCDSCIGIALIENGDYRKPVEHKCNITRLYNRRRIENEEKLQTA